MSRYKKYKMTAISSKFSEKGGYRAQFVADGYSIDARRDILPAAIKETGVQIGEGAAWDLINRFLTMCSNRAATTGETVTVGSLLSFYLAIRGWFANKDSKASKENVRVSAKLLDDLRPTVVFSMSNENDGVTLLLVTVMSDGCALGHVKQAAKFRINGKYLQLLEGDKVTASAKNAAGETVEAECAVIESAEDHIDATLPATFNDASFIGREITLTVEGRCGDPEAGTQTKSITATLDDGGDAPKVEYAYSDGHEDERNKIVCDDRNTLNLIGTGLTGASVRLVFTHDGEFREVDVPADKITGSDKHLKIDGEWIADNLPPETGDVSVSISTGFGDTDMVLSR